MKNRPSPVRMCPHIARKAVQQVASSSNIGRAKEGPRDLSDERYVVAQIPDEWVDVADAFPLGIVTDEAYAHHCRALQNTLLRLAVSGRILVDHEYVVGRCNGVCCGVTVYLVRRVRASEASCDRVQ